MLTINKWKTEFILFFFIIFFGLIAPVNAIAAPSISTPVANATLTSSSETFTWSADGTTVLEWWMYVGTSQGGSDILDSGSLGSSLSTTVTGLPTDGSTVHVALYYRTSAGWSSVDTQYTAHTIVVVPPEISSPVAGSTLTGSSQTFTWTANTTSVSSWWVEIGSSLGAKDIHDSGELGAVLSTTVTGLPIDGSTLFVRLYYKTGSTWLELDTQYTAASSSGNNFDETETQLIAAQFVDSATSATCAGDLVAVATLNSGSNSMTVDFTFGADLDLSVLEPDGTCVSFDNIPAGSGTHGGNVTSGGSETYTIADGPAGDYRILAIHNGTAEDVDAHIVGTNGTVDLSPAFAPSLISPAASSTLTGSSQTFHWNANGSDVAEWWMYVGTSQGAFDIHDSGSLGTDLSDAVTGMPTDGSTLFVRLFYRIGSTWDSIDTEYTAENVAASTPEISSPVAGSTLSGSSATFDWINNGVSVLEWWMYVGTTDGASDIYDSGSLGTAPSTTVTGLPIDGSNLFVTLFYRTSTGWLSTKEQYTAATIAVSAPSISNPVANATLSGSSETFTWADNGTSVTDWWMYVGTSQGASDIHDSGALGAVLSTTVSGLPTDGSAVFVSLYYKTGGVWLSVDTEYTAATNSGTNFSETETQLIAVQFIDTATSNTCAGDVVAVVNLNDSANSLNVELAFAGNLDLSVLEPDGTCVWSLNATGNGSHTDVDSTHETYAITNGPVGDYRIVANHHGSSENGTVTITGTNGTVDLSPVLAPSMSSPVASSTLAGSSQTFHWNANGSDVAEWWMYVGTLQGASDIQDVGSLGTDLSVAVTGLPTNGSALFVRLFYRIGSTWDSVDTEYTAKNVAASTPAISSPAAGSTLSGSSATFDWTDNGVSVLEWWMYVGTTDGASDIYDSGSLGTASSTTVTGLPLDGSNLFVTLFYRTSTGWLSTKEQYTADTIAVSAPSISSPLANTTLTGSSETFNWVDNGTSVTDWWMYVGTSLGAKDIHDSGALGAVLSTTVSGLPTDSSAVFVRLYYKAGGTWTFVDTQYTATLDTGTPFDETEMQLINAQFIDSAVSDTCAGDVVAVVNLNNSTNSLNVDLSFVNDLELSVLEPDGTCVSHTNPTSANGGSHAGNKSSDGTNSVTETYAITDGPLGDYRIVAIHNGASEDGDVHITGLNGTVDLAPALEPSISSPVTSSTLAGSSQTFHWNANGTDVLEWWMYIGTSQGAKDIQDVGSLGTDLSTAVTGLPTDGNTVFVRLFYRLADTTTAWPSVDFQYTANVFNKTETQSIDSQFVDFATSDTCAGTVVAVATLNSGDNVLTVDLASAGDLDLGVKEPDGTCVWSQSTSSINGGSHNGDGSIGGTETYAITNGPAGDYTIVANYHGANPENGDVHVFGNNGSVNLTP